MSFIGFKIFLNSTKNEYEFFSMHFSFVKRYIMCIPKGEKTKKFHFTSISSIILETRSTSRDRKCISHLARPCLESTCASGS